MILHHSTPYAIDKDLGKAYNHAMSLIGEDDWMCFRDTDTMFLLPEQPAMIEEYIGLLPGAGLLTCYTNRIHHSSPQLRDSQINENDSIRDHIEIAWANKQRGTIYIEVTKNISGFLMVISKRTWNAIPFPEGSLIGTDTLYWQRLVAAGKKMYLMKSIYVWHTYRLMNGVHDKRHLI